MTNGLAWAPNQAPVVPDEVSWAPSPPRPGHAPTLRVVRGQSHGSLCHCTLQTVPQSVAGRSLWVPPS